MARSRIGLKDIFILILAVFVVRFVMLFMGVYIIGFPIIDDLIGPFVAKVQQRL